MNELDQAKKELDDFFEDEQNKKVDKTSITNEPNNNDPNKIPTAYLTHTGLQEKADKTTTYTKIEVDTELSTKANKTELNTKANITYVDAELSTKANKTEVESKADKIEVETELSNKADESYVDNNFVTNQNLDQQIEDKIYEIRKEEYGH